MMVLLLQDHIDLLDDSFCIVIQTSTGIHRVLLVLVATLTIEFGQCANLEGLRVRAQDEVLATRAETTCSDRLIVPELGHLGHMTHS